MWYFSLIKSCRMLHWVGTHSQKMGPKHTLAAAFYEMLPLILFSMKYELRNLNATWERTLPNCGFCSLAWQLLTSFPDYSTHTQWVVRSSCLRESAKFNPSLCGFYNHWEPPPLHTVSFEPLYLVKIFIFLCKTPKFWSNISKHRLKNSKCAGVSLDLIFHNHFW